MQRLLLAIARRSVRLYYRVEHHGGRVPSEGPLVLVGNHPNGLVDPVLVADAAQRPVRFLGKAPLLDLPVLGRVMRGLEMLPVYRRQDGADAGANERTFAAVHAALAEGDAVCLFPEGRSYDEPRLQELRTGAARMALGAEAGRGWDLGVRIVPVGLVYRTKRRFRSEVSVFTGAPIAVAPFRARHAEDERAAVTELTAAIAAGLRGVTLDLERWEDYPLVELAERVVGGRREGVLARQQRVAAALRALRTTDPARAAELAQRVEQYGDRLARLGLRPDDVPLRLERPYRPGAVARFVLRNLAVLFLGLPFALAGALFWFLPNRLAGWLPRRYVEPDTLVTGRILAAAVVFPAWLLLAALATWSLAGSSAALALALGAALLGPLALAFRDWRLETVSEIRIFFSLAAHRSLRRLLADERERLARDLLEATDGATGAGPS